MKMPFWPHMRGERDIELGLSRVYQLLERLGNPHLKLPPVVHIAGTNGKGSTLSFLRSMMRDAGLKAHAYTSPHMVKFNERIVVAGRMISDELLTEVLSDCRDAAGDLPITFFEGTTVAAILAFSRVPADATLLEVGLGGRLDATNVVPQPELTVITPVAMDHTDYLGDTLAKIAAEKAGILKAGVPCVVSQQEQAAAEAIAAKARELGVPLIRYGQEWHAEPHEDGSFALLEGGIRTDCPTPSLLGAHQIVNAATAAVAFGMMPFGHLREGALRGIARTTWPARMQHLHAGCYGTPHEVEVWLDGGHNQQGGQMLAAALKTMALKTFPAQKTGLIIGMKQDKDASAFLESLKGCADAVRTVAIPVEASPFNCYAPEDLAALASTHLAAAAPAASVREGLSALVAEGCTRLVICGSLYLAGSVLEELA